MATMKIIPAGLGSRISNLTAIQRKLSDEIKQISQIIIRLEESENEHHEKLTTPSDAIGFISFAHKHIEKQERIGKVRLSEHYTVAVNSLTRFLGKKDIPFEEFDESLMAIYECHLKRHGLCPNSTSYYMRNLRAIYNHAVSQRLTEQAYPFKHVYTGVAKTVKRALTVDTIKALRRLNLKDDPTSELARDLFLFSFYTRGMAIIDVAFLRKSDLRNGMLAYRRQKTGRQITIKWEQQMQEIVNHHQGKKESDFMLPLIDSDKPDYRRQYLNAYNKLSRRLKKIGELLGLTEPLTFHRSRHSWASIARENNVPLSVICEGMGHDSEKTTRIYLSTLDTSAIDKANRRIMRLLDK